MSGTKGVKSSGAWLAGGFSNSVVSHKSQIFVLMSRCSARGLRG